VEEGLTEEDENNMDSCPNDEDDEYEKIQQELREDYLNIWTSDGEVPFSVDEIRRGVANMTKVIGRITQRQQQLGLN
jgi:endonuclease YncB( thermonuclease family)